MVSRGKVGNSQHFPTNLHVLLDEAEKANHAHIVSWCSQGHSFKIHDQDALVPLLAKYFRQTKFKSFLRQLQSYGFHRTTRGCDKGTVSHPFFVRGRRSLCFRMTRKPTGASQQAAVAAASTHTAIPRTVTNPSNMVYQLTALPGNVIQPLLRKVNSEPVYQNSMQRTVTMNGPGAYNEVSKMRNEAFGNPMGSQEDGFGSSNHHALNANMFAKLQPLKRRRSSSNDILGHNRMKFNANKIRRSSDPVIMTSAQRESLMKCAEVDYRMDSSPPRQAPLDFLLSIKESSPSNLEADEVPSVQQQQQQQQVLFQVQRGQHQEQLPQALPQDQGLVQQVQVTRTLGPQNQVRVKYQAYPDADLEPVPVQHSPINCNARAGNVFSHQDVVEKINQAKQDMEKHFRAQYMKTGHQEPTPIPGYCPSGHGIQGHQYSHQEQQQPVGSHGMQKQEPEQKHKHHQAHLQKQEKLPSAGTAHPVFAQQKSDAFAKDIFAMHNLPPTNFELSFSTSELNVNNKGKEEKTIPSREGNPVGNSSSFSLSISSGGGLPSLNGFVRPMPPVCGNTDSLLPITIQSDHNNHEKWQQPQQQIHHAAFSQRQMEDPLSAANDPGQCCKRSDCTEEGTVDYLLQNGAGGCEEWEMKAEEVAEGLNYYGFLGNNNETARADPAPTEQCHSDPRAFHHNQHHNSTPLPIHHPYPGSEQTFLNNRQ